MTMVTVCEPKRVYPAAVAPTGKAVTRGIELAMVVPLGIM